MPHTLNYLFLIISLIFLPLPLYAGQSQVTTRFRNDGQLMASVVSVDITPEIGVPLGGYGGGARRQMFDNIFSDYKYTTYFAPSTGVRDPVRSKVMLLRKGRKNLLFISLDIVGITSDICNDIIKRILKSGFRKREILISATHTHSGSGDISKNPVWELIAMDKFNPEVYSHFISGIEDSVHHALDALEPAELYATSFKATGLQRNRRMKTKGFDAQANILLVRNQSGRWLGGLVNLPIHGTSLYCKNLKFSADVPGSIEHAVEKKLNNLNGGKRATAIFINGAEGDVKPIHSGDKWMKIIGQNFSDQMMRAMSRKRKIEPVWKISTRTVELGSAYFRLKNCVKQDYLRKLIWGKLHWNLEEDMPDKTIITQIRLGDMVMMSWPGEANTSLGRMLKKMATRKGYAQSWVLGLTNDHLAYFTSPEEYNEGLYESCNSLYGAQGGMKIIHAHKSLLQ